MQVHGHRGFEGAQALIDAQHGGRIGPQQGHAVNLAIEPVEKPATVPGLTRPIPMGACKAHMKHCQDAKK